VTSVVGVDSSTQSVKVVVRDLETGALVRTARAPHPDATEVDPEVWWQALSTALTEADALGPDVVALSVAGQQHGMVACDAEGGVVRPALLWNDTRSAADAADLVAELGGPKAWADAVGSVPVASFTVSKVRWLARAEPHNAARTARVLLPHDWLTARLARADIGNARPWTDRGDASGTGYFSPAAGTYRRDLLRLALGHDADLPDVLAPDAAGGCVHGTDIRLAAGTGDNMAAALALDAREGDVVVSLGTSGTAFAVSAWPAADATGAVAGFADATGRYLPLVCTLNAARVLVATAALLGTDVDGLSALALTAPPGAGGLTLVPYLDGERTPNLPDATGMLAGLTRASMTPVNLARAAVEGMLCGLADAVDALLAQGVEVRRILLIGGAAANPAVVAVARTVFEAPVVVPPTGEYVADGAARQAAWIATGSLPAWSAGQGGVEWEPAPAPVVREQYRAAAARCYSGR
jgi:xylulokinase